MSLPIIASCDNDFDCGCDCCYSYNFAINMTYFFSLKSQYIRFDIIFYMYLILTAHQKDETE